MQFSIQFLNDFASVTHVNRMAKCSHVPIFLLILVEFFIFLPFSSDCWMEIRRQPNLKGYYDRISTFHFYVHTICTLSKAFLKEKSYRKLYHEIAPLNIITQYTVKPAVMVTFV